MSDTVVIPIPSEREEKVRQARQVALDPTALETEKVEARTVLAGEVFAVLRKTPNATDEEIATTIGLNQGPHGYGASLVKTLRASKDFKMVKEIAFRNIIDIVSDRQIYETVKNIVLNKKASDRDKINACKVLTECMEIMNPEGRNTQNIYINIEGHKHQFFLVHREWEQREIDGDKHLIHTPSFEAGARQSKLHQVCGESGCHLLRYGSDLRQTYFEQDNEA